MIVAIDGPAGAGKSTTARLVAERFGWVYVDTGAMYRAVAWLTQRAGLDPQHDTAAVAQLAETAHIVLHATGVEVDGQDVSAAIRTPEIAQVASQVAALPAVRDAMVALQRRIGREGEARTGGAVLEGRDIQTIVFPDAEVKIFLTADLTTRATRRTAELTQHEAGTAQGDSPTVESSRHDLSERDSRDENRAVAPLQAASDAALLSTDGLTPDQVVQHIAQLIESALAPVAVAPPASTTPASTTSASTTPAVAPATTAKPTPEDREIVPIHDFIYHFMLWSYKQFFKLWGWKVHGTSNVPRDGAVIIAPNHVSMFDPPLVGCATPRPVTTMGKAELFEKRTFGIKILGFIIQHMGTFPVKRGSADRRAMRRAQQVLRDGGALVIFPEGTRTKNGDLGPPELGLAMLAHSAKVPIVPAYIAGTEGGLSNLEPKLRPVHVQIWYGTPLTFEAEYARKGNRATLQAIADRVMDEIRALREAAGTTGWRDWPVNKTAVPEQLQAVPSPDTLPPAGATSATSEAETNLNGIRNV